MLPKLLAVPEFQFLNQEGKELTSRDLLEQVTLVNFIFTKCPTVCPILTQTMKEISSRTTNPRIHFLSISVDPEHDTPAVLKAYAEKQGADLSRWNFLTGPLDRISDAVIKGFKMTLIKEPKKNAQKEVEDLYDITHGEHFVLVDKDGYIRAFRAIQTEADKQSVLSDLEALSLE